MMNKSPESPLKQTDDMLLPTDTSPTTVIVEHLGDARGAKKHLYDGNTAMGPKAPPLTSSSSPSNTATKRCSKVVRFTLPSSTDIARKWCDTRRNSAPLDDLEKDRQHDEADEDRSTCWYTRKELIQFHRQAKLQLRRYQSENEVWIKDVCDGLFCSNTVQTLKAMLTMYKPPSEEDDDDDVPDSDSVRGLLEHFDTRMIDNRRLHTQKVLFIQAKLKACRSEQQPPSNTTTTTSTSNPRGEEAILRLSSKQSSRPSRILGRWFAYYDYLDVVQIIQQELELEDEAAAEEEQQEKRGHQQSPQSNEDDDVLSALGKL